LNTIQTPQVYLNFRQKEDIKYNTKQWQMLYAAFDNPNHQHIKDIAQSQKKTKKTSSRHHAGKTNIT
jgi:hypothetical protein